MILIVTIPLHEGCRIGGSRIQACPNKLGRRRSGPLCCFITPWDGGCAGIAHPGGSAPKTFARGSPAAWVRGMRGRLAALTTLLAGLIAGCRSVPPPSSGSTGQPFSCDHFDPALLSQAIFEETNRAREIHGVEPLEHIAGLDEAADLQAFHMSL